MPEVRLRAATPADALPLSVLASQVFLETYAQKGISVQTAREVTQTLGVDAIGQLLARPRARLVVAELEESLVGFVQAAPGLVPGRSNLQAVEIQRLYVLRGWTGRGIGARLLRQAEDDARAGGATQAWLTVWVGNERALAFYARGGWRDVGAATYRFEEQCWENRVLLKELTGKAARK